MNPKKVLVGVLVTSTVAVTALALGHKSVKQIVSKALSARAADLLADGQQIFRSDTFGSEKFWGDKLQLHKAILGSANGGVGKGVSPTTALGVGLKVDIASLSPETLKSIQDKTVDLNDPKVSVALLKENAIVGLKGIFDQSGNLTSVGITCALCHSTVDDELTKGLGKRLDGWPNRDLDVGAIVNLSPDLTVVNDLLGVSDETTRKVILAWGPGRYDAHLLLDGKGFRDDGKTSAVLLPPAYGLIGVNLHTYTGWGSVPYWNAFVANLQMHGQGNFYDPRLDDATKFPVAAKAKLGHVTNKDDLISSKLPALHYYQLSLAAPAPPAGSFDPAKATRGQALFLDKAKCATCHVPPTYSDPGYNMHAADEIGIDDFQAKRSPDEKYRTTPLKGAWARAKGGYYHDGRFADLTAVVEHYDDHLGLSLSDDEKSDLVEFLKSL
ncbi:hypothetical protein [Bdellovibrio sp. HCB337]|uniref:hypothetical protein n=1 Tax=Bdellovibrio sp. HCB337 TaxID=3394358 RepID=UPI0039A6AE00